MAVSPKLIVLGVLGAAFLAAQVLPPEWLEFGPDRPAAPTRDSCGETTAFVMSQTFVKRQLKAPSTANFPWSSSDGVSIRRKGGCRFEVSAYVDAENSFGAKIRSPYVVHLWSDDRGDTWSADRVDIR